MTLVPAYLNGLSEATLAAYARWNDALIERAEHTFDCTTCDLFTHRCPVGAALADAEQAAYGVFHARRREERG